MNKFLLWVVLVVWSVGLRAQYAPAAGQPGTTAMYKDSTAFTGWAVSCTVSRGFINVEDTTETYTQGDTISNRAFFGAPEQAVGKAGGAQDVVSLGDGGSALLTFARPITNGPGPDFAVFENGFKAQDGSGYYLELAFVEVSSDGQHFVRFPAVSLTQDTAQVAGFGALDPTKIHNLAGKYVAGYGTPFDLQELADSSGIDIDSINYVRIVDVVGDIDSAFARYDSRGHKINDPWPTPFWTGGFDLDAVGVIHEKSITGMAAHPMAKNNLLVYPNPADGKVVVENRQTAQKSFSCAVFSLSGKRVKSWVSEGKTVRINTSLWPNGLYVLKIRSGTHVVIKKLIIKH
jgi:hypothetical protein